MYQSVSFSVHFSTKKVLHCLSVNPVPIYRLYYMAKSLWTTPLNGQVWLFQSFLRPNLNATAYSDILETQNLPPFFFFFLNKLIGLHKSSSFRMNCNTNCEPSPITGPNTLVESLPSRVKCQISANRSVNAYNFKIRSSKIAYCVWVSMYFWLCYIFFDLMMLIFVNFPFN